MKKICKKQIKEKKQILHMHLEQTAQKILYPFPWRHTLRTIFILLIFAPFVFLPLPALTLMLINNPPTPSADKSWIGILLLYAIALFALIMWLQKLAFFIYKAYHAHKKGFFLYADSQGLEHCLFPAIAWQHVQSISPENIKTPNFTHYGISVTLHAAWIQQHPISRWWSYIALILNRTKRRYAHNVLYLPCSPLGTNAPIAAIELNVLHRKHNQQTDTWSPKLIELLTEYGEPNPKAWLEEKLQGIQKELKQLYAKKNLTEIDRFEADDYLQQLHDLFAPDGGVHTNYLVEDAQFYKSLFKQKHLMHELNAIGKAMNHIDAQHTPTQQQIAQKEVLAEQELALITEIEAIHDKMMQEIKIP